MITAHEIDQSLMLRPPSDYWVSIVRSLIADRERLLRETRELRQQLAEAEHLADVRHREVHFLEGEIRKADERAETFKQEARELADELARRAGSCQHAVACHAR